MNMSAYYYLDHNNVKEKNMFVSVPGIWVNGQVYWMKNQKERILYEDGITIKYKQSQKNNSLNVTELFLTNHSSKSQYIKILMSHHASYLPNKHMAFISPLENAIIHHCQEELFLMSGTCNGKTIQQYTIQPVWKIQAEEYWTSLTKGLLKYSPMAKGLLTSIFTLEVKIEPNSTVKASTWILSGTNKEQLMNHNRLLLKNTLAFPNKK